METKALISRALRKKGESYRLMSPGESDADGMLTRIFDRFGWVNASYVYGLQIVNAHMRRALGTLTPYETFVKAIELNNERAMANLTL